MSGAGGGGERIVDLNVDAGESFGAYRIGEDEGMLPLVTSANVACGLHGGDPVVMRRTVRLAAANGVAVGAHPGYPDLQGFGRRAMAMPPADLVQVLLYQIGALSAIAAAEAMALQHVKPHGALYNTAVADPEVGAAVIEAVGSAGLPLIALSGSRWAARARAAGLRVAEEAYIDRGYLPDGTLVPRGRPGALITDPGEAAGRARRLVTEGLVTAVSGETIAVRADTLCIHSDTPGAAAIAAQVRRVLLDAGVRIAPLRDWLFMS
ncbi:MAG: 5-oxoprolinase subunit PxpA [Armatimonadetes bacterium]|nr:5-oxoprolinase subunit PxpA [Armatimonadota bacterium]